MTVRSLASVETVGWQLDEVILIPPYDESQPSLTRATTIYGARQEFALAIIEQVARERRLTKAQVLAHFVMNTVQFNGQFPRELMRSVVIKNLIAFVNACQIPNVGFWATEDLLVYWAKRRVHRQEK